MKTGMPFGLRLTTGVSKKPLGDYPDFHPSAPIKAVGSPSRRFH